jgi:hypothetical protein
MTRTAACGQVGVCYDTFLSWGRRKVGFWAAVEQAEAEAEARFTEVLAKAAFGHEVIKTRRTTKANGEVEETVETSWVFSWKAALEWLKRRRRRDWGENVHLNVEEEIASLLAQLSELQGGRSGLRSDRGERASSSVRRLPVTPSPMTIQSPMSAREMAPGNPMTTW